MQPAVSELVLDSEAIGRIVRRMASEIIERTRGINQLGLVGVRRGGVPVAERLAAAIAEATGRQVPVGTVDITLYRDDAATALPDPKIGPSEVSFDIEGRDVVLVDDVLHTGRTVRAAIDCLHDYGRPHRIWLAVLCDRGGRELPIEANFVGRRVPVPQGFVLDVAMSPGHERAMLLPRANGRPGVQSE